MNIREKLLRLTRLYIKEALAKEAGLCPATIYDCLKGKKNPSRKSCMALARVLGVDAGWLMNDGDDRPPVWVNAPAAGRQVAQATAA